LSYEFRNENNEKITGVLKQLKTIHQNGSHIVKNTQTMRTDGQPSSQSQSQEASIIKGVDGNYSIVLTYLNEGDFTHEFRTHYGTEVLKIINIDSRISLSGVYYTDRQPFQTKGKISVTQTSKKIK
jgi:predicted transposase YbfD/YdcC